MPIRDHGEEATTERSRAKTTLTYLIINSNIEFNQEQLFKILKLSLSQQHIYDNLIRNINDVARKLYLEVKHDNLSNYPMTNIQYLSFFIADIFPGIFYVPVPKPVVVGNQTTGSILTRKRTQEIVTLTQQICKYNEMWIVTYLLKVEFNKVVQELNR
ncbi:hypothetical protein SBY92_000756 [Candida maltosa Xu316]|uniref:Uncharacterized protein n=1 Tax=Candida maltosa (strain Xu316) TaxID=1245528 RepID=M3JXI3_CANMX|nr:hypothetical protein G210_2621 [Candida maltosa Xu316]